MSIDIIFGIARLRKLYFLVIIFPRIRGPGCKFLSSTFTLQRLTFPDHIVNEFSLLLMTRS